MRLNKKFFRILVHLKGKLEKMRRYAEPFVLLVIGIDDFERFPAPARPRSKPWRIS